MTTRSYASVSAEQWQKRWPGREELTEWGILQAGDIVKLTREQGDFKVMSVVVDDGVPLWWNLYGGKRHHEMLRSVTFDRIKTPPQRQLDRQRRDRAARAAK